MFLHRHIESSKEILRHIATRNTSWPEYCLSALDELTSAVKEMSSVHNMWSSNGTSGAPTAGQSTNSGIAPASGSRTQVQAPTLTNSAQNNQAGQRQANLSGLPRVVASSPGIMEDPGSHAPSEESPQRRPPEWQRSAMGLSQGTAHYPAYDTSPGLAGTPHQTGTPWNNYQQPLPAGQFPPDLPYEAAAEPGTIPGEGQESMMWYDQLFATSFSAIDNPFLAAAHLDPSIDPTWSYLR